LQWGGVAGSGGGSPSCLRGLGVKPQAVWGQKGSGDNASSHRRQCTQPLEARGARGEDPALGDFCKFSIKITHFYAYFGQNKYLKQ